MPEEIKEILKKLEEHGHGAYLVGGSLRDYLMGIEPTDFDITTSAKPDEIEEIFKEDILYTIGKKYGTIVIKYGNYEVEITTFRLESEYERSRRPKNVFFTTNLEDDLSRRDFTINAMAMGINENIVDLYNGQKDINNKVIRAVGIAENRIKEDGLRILRAIRFATRYNFKLDKDLKLAIYNNRFIINNISKERINQEISKILLEEIPSRGFKLLNELGILEILFPDLQKTVGYDQKTPFHSRTLFDHLLCVVDSVPRDLDTRIAAIFHDIAKPETLTIDGDGKGHFYGHDKLGGERVKKILKEFKFSNKQIENVSILINSHMKVHDEMSDKALRRQIRNVGVENVLKLYDLMIADRFCTIIDRDVKFLEERKVRVKELLNENTSNDKFLEINGNDIMYLGYKEGKIIGEILNYLKEKVLDEPELNKKNILIDLVKKYRR